MWRAERFSTTDFKKRKSKKKINEGKIVKQVAEQQHSQSSEIEKSKTVLFQLQFQELEKEMEFILLETKTTEREIYQQDDAIEMTKSNCENLEAQVKALYSENIKLRLDAETVQEEFEMTFARNNEYREKIKAHKHLFWEVESKMPVMIELAKKQAMVKELKIKMEELMRDLQNPEGSVIKQVQEEITFLKREVTEVKELISKKTDLLEEEKILHAKLRKEIELHVLICRLTPAPRLRACCMTSTYHVESQLLALHALRVIGLLSKICQEYLSSQDSEPPDTS
uniref:Coiled-coil domain containing 122 n=1 Tax=Dromaius novaehollandiae TaxID=8790 RepID=A0A8C4K729_DRONO